MSCFLANRYVLAVSFVVGVVCLLFAPHGAAVTLLNGPDIQSGYSAEEEDNNSTSFSYSVVIPAPTELAIVGVTNRNHRKATATLGGETMTELVDHEGEDQRAQLFSLVNPPTDSQTIAFTFSNDTKAETSGIYCFADVDTDDFEGINSGMPLALGTYGTSPGVTFAPGSPGAPPADAVIVSLVSTKDEMDGAQLTGDGTKTVGYRRWPEHGWLIPEMNGGAMGIVTGLTGGAVTTGWSIPGTGTMAAVVIRTGNAAPSDVAPATLSVHDGDPDDTVIGTLTATDPDGEAPYTWTLTDDAGGRFKLSDDTTSVPSVDLLIADAARIDFGDAASHTVMVTVADRATYNGSFTKTIGIDVVDTTPPAITNLIATPAIARAGDSVTLDVDVIDGAGLAEDPVMTVNGQDLGSPDSSAGDTYTFSYTVPSDAPDGYAQVEVQAVDSLTNDDTVPFDNVLMLDSTPPSISGLAAAPPFATPGIVVAIEVTVADANGLAEAPTLTAGGANLGAPVSVSDNTYTYDYAVNSSAPDGPVELTVDATDNAGNSGSHTSSGVLFVDGTDPVIEAVTCADSPARAGDPVAIVITASDENGLVTAPTLTINGLDAGVPSSVDGNVYTYEYTLPMATSEGYASLVVTATDKAGNQRVLPVNDVLFVDNSAPDITDVSATPGLAAAGDTISIVATIADDSALDGDPVVEVNGDDAGAPETVTGDVYTFSYVVPADVLEGPAVLDIRARDLAGNEAIESVDDALVLDTSGPALSNIIADPGSAKAGDAVSISVDATDAYAPLAGDPEIAVNGLSLGTPASTSGNTYTYDYTVPESTVNGWATISVEAADSVGNITEKGESGALLLDTVAPVVSNIQANPDVAKDGDLVKITFSAADVTTAVEEFPEVTVNGREAAFHNRAGSAYEYRYIIDGEVDLDGPAPVEVSAADTVGNSTVVTTSNALLVDSTVPTITAVNVYPYYARDGQSVLIIFTVNDNFSLPENPVVTVNGREARYSAGQGSSYEYTYIVDQEVDEDGPALIRITAVDAMGNTGVSENNGLLIIDTTPPDGALEINEGELVTRISDVTLHLTADDGAQGTGVKMMRFSDDALNWTAWEEFAATRAWQLTAGQGHKRVYAELRDRTGNVSAAPLLATIAYDPDPLNVTVDGGLDRTVALGEDLSLEVTVTGAFGYVSYDWRKLDGDLGADQFTQGPQLNLQDAGPEDAGVYVCRVADELEMRDSPEIHVTISQPVPLGSAIMLAVCSVLLALAGAWTLRQRGRRRSTTWGLGILLVSAGLLAAPAAVAQPDAAKPGFAPYSLVYAAHTADTELSDAALESLARAQGSIELFEYNDADAVSRELLRWGAPGTGMPGFTSHLRREAIKAKAKGVAPEMLRDGREAYSVDIEGRSTIVYRLPRRAGAQVFEAALYDKQGVRRVTERRTEVVMAGEIRPVFIRIDHAEGTLVQVFEYAENPPVHAERTAPKAVSPRRADTVPLHKLLANAETRISKADADPIDRMVQFIVPPQGMENLGFDSGWVPGGDGAQPGGFIVQVRLNANAGFNYDANVSGIFTLSNTDLLTAGAASGHWGFYFGVQFFLKVAFDIPIPGFEPFVVDIPYVPDFNLVASDRDDFDSYLLETISELHNESLRQEVVDLNIIELIITQGLIDLPDWLPLPGIGVKLDVAPVADGYLTCDSIDLSDGNSFTEEGQSLGITIPPEGYLATVVYNSDAELKLGTKVYPRVFIEIGSLWSYEWPPEEDEENFLNQLEWMPVNLDDFPFSDSELNFTGQPSPGDPTDWFTQHFNLGNNNVSYKRVLFTPNLSNNYYVACIDDVTDYRTNPYDGTPLSLADNDFVEVTLQDGKEIDLYGETYSSFFVGSNGYITFTAGDTEQDVSLDNHFSLPRISGIFADLKPNEGGQIYWKQYTNRVVVTYDEVFLSDVVTENNVSCQIEMFFDGRIVITWLDLDLYGGLIGLSRGNGTPEDFEKSIFVNYPYCMDEIPDEGAIRVHFEPEGLLDPGARWRLDDGIWRESGEMEAAEVGVHTLSFNNVDGWAAPPAREVVFTKDYLMEVTETWTRQTGTVQIETSPPYASWSLVDGDEQTHTGQGTTYLYDIPTGMLEVTWPPLDTFLQPDPPIQDLLLYPDATTTFTGNYTPIIGEGRSDLVVDIGPAGAREAGAQWRFNSGAWQDSGSMLTVPDGEAVISFKDVYGWAPPANETMMIERDRVYELDYAYTRELGTVIINVDPEGAPWALIDGDGVPHVGMGDTTLEDIPTGPIQVVWGYVHTYTEPQPNPHAVELLPGDPLTVVGSYVPVLGEGEGILSIDLHPEAARADDAQWRITGGEWRDSGAMLALPDGEYTVRFKAVEGWIRPADAVLMVHRNETTAYDFDYIRQTGTVAVAVTEQAAAWSFTDSDDGVHEGTGNQTLTGIPAGSIALTWQPLEGFGTPTPATITKQLEVNGEVRFLGEYTEGGLVADFEAFPASGPAPLEVQFENRCSSSDAPIMGYRWYFGDGETSSDPNPVHVYTKPGEYTVSLAITTHDEVKTATKKHVISVNAGLPALSRTALALLAAIVMIAGALLYWRRRLPLALLLVAVFAANGAHAAEYREPHDNLTMNIGFPDWALDTDWVGVSGSAVTAQVRLTGGFDGDLLDLDLAGKGRLQCPTAPNEGELDFIGGPSAAEQNLGVTIDGTYRVIIPTLGVDNEEPIDILEPTGLFDSEVFTAYNLGGSFVLADRIDDFKLADIPVDIGGVVEGTMTVRLSIGDRIGVTINRLDTSAGSFTENGQAITVDTPDANLLVDDIAVDVSLDPDISLYFIVDIDLDIAGLTNINTRVNVPPIQVPLETLLEDEYLTEPARSVDFAIAPTLANFAINGEAAGTISPIVDLDMTHYNAPTHVMASEDPTFAGADWVPFSGTPQYELSAGDGFKTVYVKVKNANGDSVIRNDAITLYTSHPTVNEQRTNDNTPPLTGRVSCPEATVQVTVAGQTVEGVNNGAGHWEVADNTLDPIADGTYDVTVTVADPADNTLTDTTNDELTVDTVVPVVSVDPLVTNDPMPAISGAIDDPDSAVWVQVWVYNVLAENNGDGTWILPQGSILLLQGEYDLTVTAVDPVGNTSQDIAFMGLLVDLAPPAVTVDARFTGDDTPALTGEIDDIDATINIVVAGQTVSADNLGDGTWRVPDNTLDPIAAGTYDVQATAVDPAGNTGTDNTTDELTIDLDALTVTVDTCITNNPAPAITGTVNKDIATVSITLDGQTYPVDNLGDGTWRLAAGAVAPLEDGVYDVHAEANDGINTVQDADVNELTIDTQPPEATVTRLGASPTSADILHFAVVFSEPVAPTFSLADVVLFGDKPQVLTVNISGEDPEYSVAVTLADPDEQGTLGIQIEGSGVLDAAGNPCNTVSSALYEVANWCGFAQAPTSARNYFGDAQTFRAVPACAAEWAHYQWWHEPAGGTKTAQTIGSDSPELTLDNLTPADAGAYWCVVTYDGESYESAHATLTLTDPLHIVEAPPAEVSPPSRRRYSLRFRTAGGFTPVTYHWTRDDVPVTTTEPIEDGSILHLEEVDDSVAGLYRVEAIDDNGAAVMTTTTLIPGAPLPLSVISMAGAAAALAVLGGILATRKNKRPARCGLE